MVKIIIGFILFRLNIITAHTFISSSQKIFRGTCSCIANSKRRQRLLYDLFRWLCIILVNRWIIILNWNVRKRKIFIVIIFLSFAGIILKRYTSFHIKINIIICIITIINIVNFCSIKIIVLGDWYNYICSANFICTFRLISQ